MPGPRWPSWAGSRASSAGSTWPATWWVHCWRSDTSIVFGSLLAYSAYEWLLRNAPSRITGTYAFVNPIVAVLLGWWLLDEDLGARTGLAAAIIVGAVALIVLPRRDP